MQLSRKLILIYIFWFETVSEDKQSNFKRLKMLSETKCTKSFSNNFSKRYDVFLLEPFIYCAKIIKVCSVRKLSIPVGYLLFGSDLNIKF